MPAAAVIPAPIAYIKVVAVKKLVVAYLNGVNRSSPKGVCTFVSSLFIFECIYSDIHLLE